METKYEVYEDNAGGLYVVILNSDGQPLRIFENWEYGADGNLAEACAELDANPSAYEGWEGDLLVRINDNLADYGKEPMTIGELYDEINANTLIAENGANYPEAMGSAGLRAFAAERA